MCDLKTNLTFKLTHMETKEIKKRSATELVKEIKRRTKRKFSAEEKIKNHENDILKNLEGKGIATIIMWHYCISVTIPL